LVEQLRVHGQLAPQESRSSSSKDRPPSAQVKSKSGMDEAGG